MKIVKKGWIGRTLPKISLINYDENTHQYKIYMEPKKGMAGDWQKSDWPPRRCVITVEVSND